MAFDDLPLTRPAEPAPPPPGGPSPTRWIVVGAVAVALGALLVLWWMTRSRVDTARPMPAAATDVAVGSRRPKRQPIELPPLDESDSVFADLVRTLSNHPLLARLLATKGIVRAVVLAVEQIGDGRTPSDPLQPLQPATRLSILGTDAGKIDPASYARWNSATESLVTIGPNDAAQLYVNVKLLLDDAYRQLGHPGGDFDDSVARAIDMLLATPAASSDAELVRQHGFLVYTDPALQALRPVQKQLLLVGPDNQRKIVNWLRQFASILELKVG